VSIVVLAATGSCLMSILEEAFGIVRIVTSISSLLTNVVRGVSSLGEVLGDFEYERIGGFNSPILACFARRCYCGRDRVVFWCL
jgi:hypothetical protein